MEKHDASGEAWKVLLVAGAITALLAHFVVPFVNGYDYRAVLAVAPLWHWWLVGGAIAVSALAWYMVRPLKRLTIGHFLMGAGVAVFALAVFGSIVTGRATGGAATAGLATSVQATGLVAVALFLAGFLTHRRALEAGKRGSSVRG